jgi:hypothetical protein
MCRTRSGSLNIPRLTTSPRGGPQTLAGFLFGPPLLLTQDLRGMRRHVKLPGACGNERRRPIPWGCRRRSVPRSAPLRARGHRAGVLPRRTSPPVVGPCHGSKKWATFHADVGPSPVAPFRTATGDRTLSSLLPPVSGARPIQCGIMDATMRRPHPSPLL